jgi:hypothetical protein
LEGSQGAFRVACHEEAFQEESQGASCPCPSHPCQEAFLPCPPFLEEACLVRYFGRGGVGWVGVGKGMGWDKIGCVIE